MNDVLSSWLPTQLKDGWRLTKNREFCSIVNGYPCPSEEFNTNGEGIPIVRIRDITSGSTNTYFKGEYPSEQIINTNDLLIGMDGDFNVRLWSSGKALLNQRCCNVRCKDELIKKYLYFVLPIQLKIINELKNSTTVKHLNNEDILDAQIVIPNKYDHISKIVNYLDSKTKCIDRILSVLNDILEKIIAYRQSLITRAVTKGLDGDHQTSFIPLKYLAKLNPDVEQAMSDEIEYLPMEKVKNGMFLHHSDKLANLPPSLNSFEDGDILLAKVTPCFENGNICLAENCKGGVGRCSTELFVLRPNPQKVMPKFLMLLLQTQSFKQEAACQMRGTGGLKRIPADWLCNYKFPIPSLEKQKQIVEYMASKHSNLDGLTKKIKDSICLLNDYRSSLISAAVTGQLAIEEASA